MAGQLINTVKNWVSPNSNTTSPPSTKLDAKKDEITYADASLEDIAIALNSAALKASSFRIALLQTLKLNMPQAYAQVIIDLTNLTKDSATSWALLIEWLTEQSTPKISLEKHAQRLLRNQLSLVSQEMKLQAIAIFKKTSTNSESHS